MKTLGDLLREGREAKGVTLAQAEKDTKIRERILADLEADNHKHLPPPVFLKGLLRKYATYLKLDVAEVLASYAAQYPEAAAPPPPAPPPVPVAIEQPLLQARPLAERRWFSTSGIALAGVALVLIALAVWIASQVAPNLPALLTRAATPTSAVRPLPSPTPNPTPSTPTPTRAPSPTPRLVPGIELKIQVVERTWLRVEADDNKVFEGTLNEGTTQTWTADRQMMLHLGNAAGGVVTVNGRDLGRLGQPNEVVRRIWTVTEAGIVVMSTPVPGLTPPASPPAITPTPGG